jgi:hypothetical protein
MRKFLRMNDPIDDILPETDSVPLVWVTNGNTSELSVQPKISFHQKEPLSLVRWGTVLL